MDSLQLGAKDKVQTLKIPHFGIDDCIYTILIILQSSVDMNHSKTWTSQAVMISLWVKSTGTLIMP